MKRLNKQVIAWMLATAMLFNVAFSDGLPFAAKAYAETSQEAGGVPEDSEDVQLFTTAIRNEGTVDTGDKFFGNKNLVCMQEENNKLQGDRTLEGPASVQDNEPKDEDFIKQEIKKNLPFSKNMEDVLDSLEEQKASLEAAQVPMVAVAQQTSEWNNKVMAKVDDSANIRQEASEESVVVGFLKKGASGDILEQNGEWTKITSGSVTGYVKNEFLAYGSEAENLANEQGRKVATVLADAVRIRKDPNEGAGILTLAAQGNTFTSISDENGWVSVTLDSGETGYIKSEFVSTELVLGKAISIEEEQAAIKAAQEKEAAEKAEKDKAAKSKSATTTSRTAMEVAIDEETLLAGLVQLEAGGESYEGKLAVASVVINRVNSSRYPGSITEVIYQNGQFPGATNGMLARILANGVKSECLKAARDAIAGNNNIGNYMHFNSNGTVNKNLYSDYIVIGNQCFY